MQIIDIEVGKIFKVIKASIDNTVQVGDIIAFGSDGKLYKGKSYDNTQSAWIDREDLTPEILSFEVE